MARFASRLVPIALAVAIAACSGAPPATGGRPAASPEAGGSGAQSDAPTQRTTLKVAYVPVLAFAPLYRALAKDYFGKAGIDVDLTVVQSASDAVAFLGAGQIDVALGNVGAALFDGINRGLNIRVVAGNSYNQQEPATLVAAPLLVRKELVDGGAIRTVGDLKGKKVAINAPAGIQEYSLGHLLDGAQLTLKDVDVQTMPFPDMLAALTNGAIDAAMVPEPFSAAAREQGVAAVLVPNPAPGATVTAVMFGENLLKLENERIGRTFLDAMRKAANELQTEQDIFSSENLAIWNEYTKVPEAQIQKGAPYAYSKDLALDARSVLDQQSFMLKAGRLDFTELLPESKLIDTRFTPRQ